MNANLTAIMLDLTTSWLTAAGKHQARAERLGNCAAGKEAFGDACVLRSCVRDVHDAIAEAAVTADA